MKKTLFALCLSLLISIGTSNAQPYTFSQLTNTYTKLSSPTVISSPYWDLSTVYTLTLPFTFKYFNTNFNKIYVKGGFEGFVYDGSGSFFSYEIFSYDNFMTDYSGNATISYETTGSAPNRILKIQTLDANFFSDPSESDYGNFQLWLYEGSNVIEMHYGISSILDSQTFYSGCPGPTVTIIKDNSSFVSLSGSASNPTASSSTASLCVTGAPPLNKVFRFVPATNGIEDLNNDITVTLSPNPSKGMFTISSTFYSNSKTDISIKNSLGQTVYNEKIFFSSSGTTVNAELEAGMYFIQVSNDMGSTIKKFIIQ